MIRLIIFALVLNIQIKIKAKSVAPKVSQVVEDPVGCLQDGIWCSIYNSAKSGQSTDLNWAKVSLSKHGSAVVMPSAERVNMIRALSGLVHVKAESKVSVETYNANIEMDTGDEVFIRIASVQNSKVIIRAVKGDLKVRPRGHKKTVELYEGFQNWYGGMTDKGAIVTGFPRPIDLKPHLRDWSQTFHLDHWEFKQSAKKFAGRWKHAVELGAELNRQFVTRSLASLKKRRKIERIRMRKEADVDAQMRRLFRKRNGL